MSLWVLEDDAWIDSWLAREREKYRPLAEVIITSFIKGEGGIYPEGAEANNRYAQTHVPPRFNTADSKLDFVMEFLFSYYRSGMWIRWYLVGDFWVIECGEGE